jgi:hypothetical protein
VRSGGAPWAKSKIILTDNINFTTLSSISMKVFTNAPVGAVLKLKVESLEPGAFADERDAETTISGEWATYTWNFPSDVPPLYSVLSLMLGYTTPNDASENATFLFDDIEQIATTLSVKNEDFLSKEGITSYPNPVKDKLIINSKSNEIKSIYIVDILGKKISSHYPNSTKALINVSELTNGIYFAKISTSLGTGSIKFVCE